MATTTTTVAPATSKPKPLLTSSPSESYRQGTIDTLTEAFEKDAMFVYMLNHVPPNKRTLYIRKLLDFALTDAAARNATYYSATLPTTSQPNPTSNEHAKFHCAINMVPPESNAKKMAWSTWVKFIFNGVIPMWLAIGWSPFSKFLDEYTREAGVTKKFTFAPGEKYYYVGHVGTLMEHRGKGLCGQLFVPILEKAQREMVPVWLEASSEMSRRVYARCGFVDSGPLIVLGKGVVGKDGELVEKGCKEAVGVTCYPMVWWPEGYVPGKEREGKKDK